ncbi:CO/xanthine dehydrogenase Mo-binding subunit [Neolewinella xylanilytica]|uniref:CO/xanthine dehydrogenase Mo-binding subunit n=1 Tax=Neolewinella xylanilytica TaxID=1514080 RepID=A0A2S6IAF2_9BACT|nr:molybdopterin cofactor-binding domain-containing protein [Neolewinella xylanilytica]PPK88480.1 CO/xanthine dehydrogenase Mo-binding subunit [Neolewinella xylanilytica]
MPTPTRDTSPSAPDRRDFLRQSGYLAIGFSLLGLESCSGEAGATGSDGTPKQATACPPDTDRIDAWLRVHEDTTVTVLTGKIAIGQGILVALRQIAAEELDLPLDKVKIIMADTGHTPNERYTAGSASIEGSGTAIRRAAATARQQLLERAADELGAAVVDLTVTDGVIGATARGERTYGELVAGKQLTAQVFRDAPRKDPYDYRIVGQPEPRPEILGMVTGRPVDDRDGYVQDMRPPGMVHARVVRPPVYRATLQSFPADGVEALPGVRQIVRDGNFLAVVATDEYAAIRAWQMLRRQSNWEVDQSLPDPANLFNDMPGRVTNSEVVTSAPNAHSDWESATARLEALYTRPYQMHGSIGPSCALAEYRDGQLTVWTHSQGVYPLRDSLAAMLDLSADNIRVIGVRGSGCYGHNGADDVAADAARLALAEPDRPVRVQWMREDEHGWEPYGSAMRLQLRAALDGDNRIVSWVTNLWTDVHSHRPGGDAAELLTAQYLEGGPEAPTEGYLGGGYRNSQPLYRIPNLHIEAHRIEGPLRVSALRSLGAYGNIFAIESFLDELADRAGEDPVAFRLKHLDDERARAVIEEVRQQVEWPVYDAEDGRGWGFAFARYKNEAAYFAVAAEVAYDAETESLRVLRLVGAIDAGQTINPDGLRNQTEGGMIQSASWTTLEEVKWNTNGIVSLDWETYPILRFPEVPEVSVSILDRPGAPPLGAGEAAQGPTAAAIANAVFRATGTRVRDLPITAAKVVG